jgi:hypothetical protein
MTLLMTSWRGSDQGGYLVDIEIEDTGMPVSEGARHRRFPYAGRPV